MRNKKLFIGFAIAVVFLLTAELYIYLDYTRVSKEEVKISFIVTGDNLDRWENMKAGAETAAMDNDCIVDFINSPVEYGVDGEIEALSKQLKDGADYVVVASGDYEAMKEFVNTNYLSDKVIFVKNGSLADFKDSIMTDDYRLGADFAQYIKADGKADKLVLVSTIEDLDTMELMEGLNDTFKDSNVKIEYRKLSATSGTINQSMYNLGQSGLFDGFITLDFATLEAAARAQGKLKKPVLIYSIDNSKEAVYYLDSNVINALAFKDDYSMGYLAVEQALLGNNKSPDNKNESLYYISDKETIHSDKLEKVLFPFVK